LQRFNNQVDKIEKLITKRANGVEGQEDLEEKDSNSD